MLKFIKRYTTVVYLTMNFTSRKRSLLNMDDKKLKESNIDVYNFDTYREKRWMDAQTHDETNMAKCYL